MNCKHEECDRPAKTRGMCRKHYMRWYMSVRPGPPCSEDLCDRVAYSKGLCPRHYSRFQKYGDPNRTSDGRFLPDDEYIKWRSTEDAHGCWIWGGSISAQGYGVASRDSRKITAHRLSFKTFHGNLPDALDVRHKCDVRRCVNPDHLESGTRADNNRDTAQRGRHGNAKLSNDDVVDIRWAHGLGATGSALARAYGVSPTAISQIVNYRSRRNAR